MDLLTVKETAQMLRVTPITVRRYIAAGRLPAVRVGRGVRVDQQAVGAFVRSIEPGPTRRKGNADVREAAPTLAYGRPRRAGPAVQSGRPEEDHQMMSLEEMRSSIDKLYGELAKLKRQLILRGPARGAADDAAWEDLMVLSREIGARWTGPDAVDEIRAQREK